jgi:hypothetical protein
MKLSYLPPYGHACCPRCKIEFGLASAAPTFLKRVPYNDTAVFFMCPKCHAEYQTASRYLRISMTSTCFANVKPTEVRTDSRYPWAITTILTLSLNGFDAVAAVENGHCLTRKQYLDICSGAYDFVALPSGMRSFTAKPTTSEAA